MLVESNMTENRFQGQYKKVGSSKVSEQDKRLLHTSNQEIKVYLTGSKEAPEGREIHTGSGGGRYYTTKKVTGTEHAQQSQNGEQSTTAPDIEGATGQVKVSGNGVGIVAGMVDGKLKVQKLGNKETTEFVKKVMDCAGGDQSKFIGCLKSQAKKEDLKISS